MLLPALAKAREKARHISCISNKKQVGLSLMFYSNDMDDFLPTARPKPLLATSSYDFWSWTQVLYYCKYAGTPMMFTCASVWAQGASYNGHWKMSAPEVANMLAKNGTFASDVDGGSWQNLPTGINSHETGGPRYWKEPHKMLRVSAITNAGGMLLASDAVYCHVKNAGWTEGSYVVPNHLGHSAGVILYADGHAVGLNRQGALEGTTGTNGSYYAGWYEASGALSMYNSRNTSLPNAWTFDGKGRRKDIYGD